MRQSKSCGYSLVEMLVAMVLMSLLAMAYFQLLPMLQHSLIRDAHFACARAAIWQLADGIAKQLRRAGYRLGKEVDAGLDILDNGHCVLLRWQNREAGRVILERFGYRFSQGSLQIRKGADSCDGPGWERITDNQQLTISHFKIAFGGLLRGKKLLVLELSGNAPQCARQLNLRRIITGENL